MKSARHATSGHGVAAALLSGCLVLLGGVLLTMLDVREILDGQQNSEEAEPVTATKKWTSGGVEVVVSVTRGVSIEGHPAPANETAEGWKERFKAAVEETEAVFPPDP